MGTYVYAILAGEHKRDLGQLGVPDGWTDVVMLPAPIHRVEGNVSGPASGLTAVVSDYYGPTFNELSKAEVMRCLAIHQRVVELVMAEGPVLPVKFGTVLPSNADVCTALRRWRDRLAGVLDGLGDVVEIEVAATWDPGQTFAAIARQPDIAVLVAAVAGRPPEETLEARVQIGKLVKEAFDNRREEYREKVLRELLPVARDAHPNLLPSEELVLNVAFLIERRRFDEFYDRVHRLDDGFENRLTFRCIGPLPPYSFATVEITRPYYGAIEAARRLLELGDQASEAELNANYRRLATRHHPDHNQGDSTSAERFAAIAAAHAQLLAYMFGQRAGEGRDGEERRYDLTREAVEATLLLALRQPQCQPVSRVEERDEQFAVV